LSVFNLTKLTYVEKFSFNMFVGIGIRSSYLVFIISKSWRNALRKVINSLVWFYFAFRTFWTKPWV